MRTLETGFEGLVMFEPRIFRDSRGYFFEAWTRDSLHEAGIDCDFVQENESMSCFGVIRGLHWQAAPYTQAKLVRTVRGEVLDVAVDIRRGSPTYGRHFSALLSEDNKRQLFIPRGFAHGFSVLSKEAVFLYKCDNLYNPESERGMLFNDKKLGIDWRLAESDWILSPKDRLHPGLDDIEPF